jgi:hypothetical protein
LKKNIGKRVKKFCSNLSALIFALPKRNNEVERKEERGFIKGV